MNDRELKVVNSNYRAKSLGTTAIVCGALWCLAVGTWWVAGAIDPVGDVEGNVSGLVYGVGYFSLLIAGVLMVLVMARLRQCQGGLGLRGVLGLVLVGLAVPAGVIAAVFVGWGSLMLVGTLLFGTAMIQRDVAPRLPTVAFGFGLSIGAVVWAIIRGFTGTLFQYSGMWGDLWVPNLVGVTVGGLVVAYGLFRLGRWAQGEPVPMPGAQQ